MADSSVSITPGTGVNIDTRTVGSGDHREVVVLGDGTNNFVAEVGPSGGLAVRGATIPTGSGVTIATGATGPTGALQANEAGNLTIYVKNATASAFTGAVVIRFEQSDNGSDWAPLMVQRMDTGLVAAVHTFQPMAISTSVVLNVALPGVNFVRAVSVTGPTANSVAIAYVAGGMPFNPIVGMQSVTRSLCTFYTAAAVQCTATETLLSLTSLRGGATVAATTTPAVVSTGKTLRITALNCTYISTTTGGYGVARLRVNTAGAVALASPVHRAVAFGAVASTTTGNSAGQVQSQPPDGIDIPAGAGIGVTLQGYSALAATAVGYGFVEVIGYEF